MSRPEPVRLEVDIEPWLLHRNDDAPEPGRVLVLAGCDVCRTAHRWRLPLGVWAIEHDHGGRWAARLLRTTAAADAPALVDDAAALAALLAPTLAAAQ